MQEVNRAVEEAGARGAAAGRIDRTYIAGARVLAFGPDGKRRTIFVMKITRTACFCHENQTPHDFCHENHASSSRARRRWQGLLRVLLDLEGRKVVPEVLLQPIPSRFRAGVETGVNHCDLASSLSSHWWPFSAQPIFLTLTPGVIGGHALPAALEMRQAEQHCTCGLCTLWRCCTAAEDRRVAGRQEEVSIVRVHKDDVEEQSLHGSL